MQSLDVYRLLTTRLRRGFVIGRILRLVCLISACAIYITDGIPWAVVAFLLCLISHMHFVNVCKSLDSAYEISRNSQIVYWAHPTSANVVCLDVPIDECTAMLLHLRDGATLEISLPKEKMRTVVDWLVEQNPSLRLGPYRAVPAPPGKSIHEARQDD